VPGFELLKTIYPQHTMRERMHTVHTSPMLFTLSLQPNLVCQ